MKKRLFAVLFAMILVIGLFPITALAAEGEYIVTEVVPFGKYETMEYCCDGLIVVSDGEAGHCHYGFIDVTGKEIVPCRYDYADAPLDYFGTNVLWNYSATRTAVAMKSDETSASGFKWGYIDKTGTEIIPCQYDYIHPFAEGLAKVGQNDKWAFIDEMGNVIVPFGKYEILHDFCDGFASVKDENGKWGVIDTTGKEFIPCQYDETASAHRLSDGLVEIALNGKHGVIDEMGQEVIPCQYDDIDRFGEGLVAVELNDKWGVIDTTGKEVISPKYDWASSFEGGLAEVTLNGNDSYIDKAGQEVISDCIRISDDLFMVNAGGIYVQDEQWGVIDRNGNEVVPRKYWYINDWNWSFRGLDLVLLGNSEGDGLLSIKKADSDDPQPTSKALTKSMFTVDTAEVTYTGNPITKTVTGKDGDKDLVLDTDYTATYADNTNVGTAKITIEGKGDYTGTLEYTFTIKAKSTTGGGSTGGGSTGGGGGSTTPSKPTKPTEPEKPVEPTKPAEPTAPVEPEKPATPASEKFGDVVKDSWYEAGVTYVTDKGLFQGVSEGVFAPDTNMTRAMLMTVLARLDGQETSGGATWYAKAMDWAKAQGISDGSAPDGSVTREQLVTMLYRYAKPEKVEGGLDGFGDKDEVSAWAKEAMEWAVANNIVTGKSGARLDPQGTATRAEVATMIQRFAEKAEK